MCISRKLMISSLALGTLFVSSSAFAVYDHAVTWADMSLLDLTPALQSQYGSPSNLLEPIIPPSAYSLVLRDADNRINPEFQVPAGMKEAVGFWLRIYTEYTTQHVVVFDERHPEIVYDVLDFRELSRTAKNRVVYEVVSQKRVKTALKNFRHALQQLGKNPRPKNPTEYQKKILAAVQKTKHKHPYKELAKNVRSQTGQRDNIVKGLLAAEAFFPKMEQVFSRFGVPTELTRLALVESSFNLNAVSYAGATGVWQFMRRSGMEYMIVDEKGGIDERLSPLKSTVASARLLLRNKKILGNWPLAVTSYNHGVRNLRRIPESWKTATRIGQVFAPCNNKASLGWASRNYYAEFLAVLYAESYRHLFYGEPPAPQMKAVVFQRVDNGQTALAIAIEKNISLQDFHFYNPDIKNMRRKLPKGFLIAIPSSSDDLASLLKKAPKQASMSITKDQARSQHRVKTSKVQTKLISARQS